MSMTLVDGDAMRDLRLASRQLLNSPAFTIVALLSLALGIGATTAMFSLVNAFLLRSLPVRNPSELVLLRTIEGPGGRLSRAGENNGSVDPVTGRSASTSFSLQFFQRLRDRPTALSDVFAFAPVSQVNILVDGQPETPVRVQLVSGGYYAGLGVPAILGRTLTADDDQPAAAAVAVISYRYWRRRFAASPDVLGKVIQVNRYAATIVGVTAQGFDGAMQVGESYDVSVPLAQHLRIQPNRTARAEPWYWWVRIMGRLAPGATPLQARASLELMFQQAAYEGWVAGRSPTSAPGEPTPGLPTLAADPGAQGERDTRRQFAWPLQVLMGMVSLVLAAACANVANLLLARGVSRRREIGLRLALGASRGRIVRQLCAESLLLAVAGAALGTVLAWWSRHLLLALHPFGAGPVVLDLPLDGRVLLFTIAVTTATALFLGLAPALRTTHVDFNAQFQSGARTLGDSTRSRLSHVLMVVQIALSLVLLVSTGLFVRTLGNLERVNAGFNIQGLVLFHVDAASSGYTDAQIAALQSRLSERLARVPGVRSVTFSSVALLSGVRQNKRITVPGITPPPGTSTIVHTNGLAPNFFTSMQLPILIGRGFTERDDRTAPPVAVVNQEFVRLYCAGENPVGRMIGIGTGPRDQVAVVGVAANAKYTVLRGATPATVYVPAFQRIDGTANFALRLSGPNSDTSGRSTDSATVFPAIRAAVREVDPTLPVQELRTQDEQIDRLHAQERLFARLSGLFGGVSLALACVGLYGLMSHAVLRRTGEIGLRMALGAVPAQVLRMILRESLTLVFLGILTGAAAAYGAGRLVATMLFGLTAADPVTYGTAALLLTAMALIAALVPAWRASTIDPIRALKIE